MFPSIFRTFACNMRAFGLSRELCMEFLRKQSTIANLSEGLLSVNASILQDVMEAVC